MDYFETSSQIYARVPTTYKKPDDYLKSHSNN
jgi:hypothetical protein